MKTFDELYSISVHSTTHESKEVEMGCCKKAQDCKKKPHSTTHENKKVQMGSCKKFQAWKKFGALIGFGYIFLM